MFNLGVGEIIIILVAALLILGPKQLPELARGLGKFFREFRRQTDEVRTVVEREFYRMDADPEPPAQPPVPTEPQILPSGASVPAETAEAAKAPEPVASTPDATPPSNSEPRQG